MNRKMEMPQARQMPTACLVKQCSNRRQAILYMVWICKLEHDRHFLSPKQVQSSLAPFQSLEKTTFLVQTP